MSFKFLRKLGAVAIVAVMSAGHLVLPSAAVAAESGLNLVTSPLPINLIVDPGKSVTTDLRVKQSGPNTERLKVSLMKFSAYGDAGKPMLEIRGPGDDYFDWVKFDRPVFDAPSNVWQTIKMTINVPKSAAFGYYYAAVITRVGDDVEKAGNTASLAGGTAILVLLDAHSPNAKRTMSLLSFEAEHRVFEFLPARFNVKFRNTGNVHIVPHGNIFILQGKKTVATLTVNSAQGNILPNSNRILPVDWQDGFPHYEEIVADGKAHLDKHGRTVKHLVWSNGGPDSKQAAPHLRFGKYSAHLFAVYDDGRRDVPVESTVEFWVLPWWILLIILLVLLLVGGGAYAAVRAAMRGAQRIGVSRRRSGRR